MYISKKLQLLPKSKPTVKGFNKKCGVSGSQTDSGETNKSRIFFVKVIIRSKIKQNSLIMICNVPYTIITKTQVQIKSNKIR